MITETMVLTVNGTSKSQRAGGLDSGEVSTFTTRPGEYRKDLDSPIDLVDNVAKSAFYRCEWISSFKLGNRDLVADYADNLLRKHQLDVNDAAVEMSEHLMFAAAELEDLMDLLKAVRSESFADI